MFASVGVALVTFTAAVDVTDVAIVDTVVLKGTNPFYCCCCCWGLVMILMLILLQVPLLLILMDGCIINFVIVITAVVEVARHMFQLKLTMHCLYFCYYH